MEHTLSFLRREASPEERKLIFELLKKMVRSMIDENLEWTKIVYGPWMEMIEKESQIDQQEKPSTSRCNKPNPAYGTFGLNHLPQFGGIPLTYNHPRTQKNFPVDTAAGRVILISLLSSMIKMFNEMEELLFQNAPPASEQPSKEPPKKNQDLPPSKKSKGSDEYA